MSDDGRARDALWQGCRVAFDRLAEAEADPAVLADLLALLAMTLDASPGWSFGAGPVADDVRKILRAAGWTFPQQSRSTLGVADVPAVFFEGYTGRLRTRLGDEGRCDEGRCVEALAAASWQGVRPRDAAAWREHLDRVFPRGMGSTPVRGPARSPFEAAGVTPTDGAEIRRRMAGAVGLGGHLVEVRHHTRRGRGRFGRGTTELMHIESFEELDVREEHNGIALLGRRGDRMVRFDCEAVTPGFAEYEVHWVQMTPGEAWSELGARYVQIRDVSTHGPRLEAILDR